MTDRPAGHLHELLLGRNVPPARAGKQQTDDFGMSLCPPGPELIAEMGPKGRPRAANCPCDLVFCHSAEDEFFNLPLESRRYLERRTTRVRHNLL